MNSNKQLKDLFENAVTGYLFLKRTDCEAEDELHAMFNYDTETRTKEYYADYINLLFYKDIVCGVWNRKASVSQAVFQLLYAVDLELSLQSLLISPSEKENLADRFQKLIHQIESIKDVDSLSVVLNSLNDDMTWIPIQKEYRSIYTFLLINMITLVYFDCSFQDTSNIEEIIETVKCLC